MIVALPLENDEGENSIISRHFGRSPYFAFVEIDENGILNYKIVKNPFEEHVVGDLPEFIAKNKANILIAYGMGERAISYFNSLGVRVILGVEGNFLNAVKAFVEGNLNVNTGWKEGEEFHHHDRD